MLDCVRSQLVTALKCAKETKNLPSEELQALKELRTDDSIVIVPADKGRKTVIIDKDKYKEKVENHLSDANTYKYLELNEQIRMETDDDKKLKIMEKPIKSLQTKMNKKLKDIEKEKKLSRSQYLNLYSSSLHIPRLYGTIKLHKDQQPIRPIVSFCGSPTENLSKFLTSIVNPVTDIAPQKMKNSFQTKEILEELVVPEDCLMVSYDVKSLFTCIPQDLAIQSLHQILTNNDQWKSKTSLELDDLIQLSKLCLESTIFSWNNSLYQQIKGTPMGSSISVVLAECTMQCIEELIFQNTSVGIKKWIRYVDDIFAVIPISQKDEFFNFINGINSNIQFTCEEELHSQIAFLDLQILKSAGGILKFKIYRKPTNTNQLLNFNSNNPSNHKRSVVGSLINRARKLCSAEFKDEETENVRLALKENNFPKRFVNNVIENMKTPTDENLSLEKPRYIAAPYIRGTSERANRIFQKYNIRLGNKPPNTLKNILSKPKDKENKSCASSVIYELECGDCDGKYIGETSKNLYSRIEQHKYNIRRGDTTSMIFQHVSNLNHEINWKNPKVLGKFKNAAPRKFMESCHSINIANTFNRFAEISDIYLPIVQEVFSSHN